MFLIRELSFQKGFSVEGDGVAVVALLSGFKLPIWKLRGQKRCSVERDRVGVPGMLLLQDSFDELREEG